MHPVSWRVEAPQGPPSPTMVDIPGEAYSPAARLRFSMLGSPLYGDLLDDLEDISRSISNDTLELPDLQSTGPGSERTVILGEERSEGTQQVSNHFIKSTFLLTMCIKPSCDQRFAWKFSRPRSFLLVCMTIPKVILNPKGHFKSQRSFASLPHKFADGSASTGNEMGNCKSMRFLVMPNTKW